MYKSEFIKKTRGLRHVVRYAQNPRIKDQDVAQHSYFVVLYTKLICDKMGYTDKIRLACLEQAILHDVHESISIDIPANVKRRSAKASSDIENTAMSELLDTEKYRNLPIPSKLLVDIVVKIADLLDVLLYAREELAMGNRFFIAVHNEVRITIDTILEGTGLVLDKGASRLQEKVYEIIKEIDNKPVESEDSIDYSSSTHIHKAI